MAKFMVMWRRVFGVSLVAALILTQFQNCAEPPATEEELSGMSVSESLSEYSKLSFPYDLVVNQVAYSSCSDGGSGPFFSLRVGAYNNDSQVMRNYMKNLTGVYPKPGGLRVRDQFLSEFNSAFNLSKINTQFKGEKFKEALGYNEKAMTAKPFLSFRPISTPYSSRLAFGSSGALEEAFGPSLGVSSVAPLFWDQYKSTDRKSYSFIGNLFDASQGAFYGQIDIPGVRQAAVIPDAVVGTGYLTVGFYQEDDAAQDGSGNAQKTPISDSSDAFIDQTLNARGLSLDFVTDNRLNAEFPKILYNITETDLSVPGGRTVPSSNNGPTPWVCPNKLRFVIIHPELQNTYCPDDESYADVMNNAEYKVTYDIVRRMLPAEDFRINMKRGCVVQLKGDGSLCYASQPSASSSTTQKVIGYITASNPNPNCGSTPVGGSVPPECPNYISVCIRE